MYFNLLLANSRYFFSFAYFKHICITFQPTLILFSVQFSELKVNLLSSKIRNIELNKQTDRKSNKCTVDVSLTNFRFELEEQIQETNKNTTFFIVAVSHDTDIYLTKPAKAANNELTISERFYFKNAEEDSCIKIEVFSITFNKEKTILESIFKKVRLFTTFFNSYDFALDIFGTFGIVWPN